MIRLGTSGFSYDDWIGPVYPAELPRWQWLPHYASEFDTVELNVTYYRVPEERVVRGWVERTPQAFLFSVKAHRSITHERKDPDFDAFREALAPLTASGKLACVLAQFPYSFHPTADHRAYLTHLREGFADLPIVVEFRNHGWVGDETFALLEQLEFGFCCVDEPQLEGLMPPVSRVTGPVGYVRFHGRNAEKWWRHDHAWERYDYSYSKQELLEWLPRLQDLGEAAPLTLVYANNHYRGQSVATVRQLKVLLTESGVV